MHSKPALVFASLFFQALCFGFQAPHTVWERQPSESTLDRSTASKLPLISVRGNRLIGANGAPVLLRGAAVGDPDKLAHQGHWNREYFEQVKNYGAMLVRIPIHPAAWRDRTPVEYLKLLDQAVAWCTDLGMYIDIDWHSIGNLEEGLYEGPLYETTKQETFNFWRTMARHFAGHNTVAFFELFNEPSTGFGQMGTAHWEDWKRTNEDLITVIRAYDVKVIPLVAGFDWAYDLSPLRLDPINAEGIGYVTHPYPTKRPKPWEGKWEEDFGFAAQRYPVMATELGFFVPPTVVNQPFEGYGPAIVQYLEQHGISWIAWALDVDWQPSLLRDWKFDLTPEGEFFKKALHGQTGP